MSSWLVINLKSLMKKTLFLASLATAMRIGELQSTSAKMSFVGSCAVLAYVPESKTKTVTVANPLIWSFIIQTLEIFWSSQMRNVACLGFKTLLRED